MDKEDQTWYEALKAKGHMPIMVDYDDEGDPPRLDVFVCDSGYHNGPGCEACRWSCCMHCKGIKSIPECDVIDGTVLTKIG